MCRNESTFSPSRRAYKCGNSSPVSCVPRLNGTQLTLPTALLPSNALERAQPPRLTPQHRHALHAPIEPVQDARDLFGRGEMHETVLVVELREEELV